MEKRTRYFYILFCGISLLFWNPVTFYLLHGNDYLYSFGTLKILFVFIFGIGILLSYLMAIGKLPAWICNVILVLSNIGILFGLLAIINHILKPAYSFSSNKNRPDVSGLIFNANQTLHHFTFEFDYTATTNSLGLRGAEIDVNKGNKYRIVCVGDSWTYGWGANDNETWPAVLEYELHQKGLKNVQVVNCAYPGGNSDDYKQTLLSIMPLLKPDLVLIGMHQLDDLAQIHERQMQKQFKNVILERTSLKDKLVHIIVLYFKKSLESLANKMRGSKGQEVQNGPSELKESIGVILASMNEAERMEYESIDSSYKHYFVTGNINPAMVDSYLRFPKRQIVFNNPFAKETQEAVLVLRKDLLDIKQLCNQNKCKAVVVNLPDAFFTEHHVLLPWKNKALYTAKENKIDSIYKSVALLNNMPYMEMTSTFLNLADKGKYFFKYDGHPNKNGYKQMGTYIANELCKMEEFKYKK